MFNALLSDSDEEDCGPALEDNQTRTKEANEQLTEPNGDTTEDENGWEIKKIKTKKHSVTCDLDLRDIVAGAATDKDTNPLSGMTYHGQFTARKNGDSTEIRLVMRSPKTLMDITPEKIKKEFPLPHPFDVPNYMLPFERLGLHEPECDMVISRGCMKDIMRAFEFDANNPYLNESSYVVQRNQTLGHLHIYDTRILSTDAAYGFGFENAMTTKPNPDANLYRCLSYTLGAGEKKVKVLLRVEVDCAMSDDDASVELKTHKSQYETRQLDYWYQMVLGNTPHLVYAILEDNGRVKELERYHIDDITPKNANNRLNELAHTLHWIKTTMSEHNKAFLSIKKNGPSITLKIIE